jgi:hypothetical protein
LITYCNTLPDTEEQRDYILTVGSKWMISAVARIMEPGCQADHVLIFEGKQGIGKSKALQVLGGDHFSDGLPDVHTKDARDHVRGKWIIEIAELSQMNKADVETVKAFITRREERFRPAYGRNELVYPRQCVFAATTNRFEFLKDDTGKPGAVHPAMSVSPIASSSSRYGNNPASEVTLEPWNPSFSRRSKSSLRTPSFVSPIG